jgi:hypothetical protein
VELPYHVQLIMIFGGRNMKPNPGSRALAIATLGLAASGGRRAAQRSPSGGTAVQKGKPGVCCYGSVSRPVGETIRSSDGRIHCGSLAGPNQLCAPVSFD